MKDQVYQQECIFCPQIITLSTPDPDVQFCLSCLSEVADEQERIEQEERDQIEAQEEEYYIEQEMIRAELEAEITLCQFDDDPSPYDGTYSEE